jgi:hypothetical protein
LNGHPASGSRSVEPGLSDIEGNIVLNVPTERKVIMTSPATEDEMVLAFLKAEIDSPRFGSRYRTILANSGLDRRSVIENADLRSEQGKLIRRELLKLVRGYGTGQALFRGFPHNVQWRRVLLDQTDLSKLKYANEPSWVALSSGTRLVS